ncbi:hypothetical protein ACFY12_20960 [Streptomyces sp. NPDC001339]|uniref:hypothetical protein n=1 Tax=Streptomyces sp. NPDC001339 TaxID=3364563 RepID=UPI0036743568
MSATTNHDRTQPMNRDDALYEALVFERYDRPLHEILWEETRHPLPELLKERHRRPELPTPGAPLRHQPQPDPDAAAHRAALLEAITPRRRSTA